MGAKYKDLSAIVLAAGQSRRMGDVNKLCLPWGDTLLIRQSVEALCAGLFAEVLVVTGHEAARIEAALRGLPLRCVWHANYAAGMGESLAAGVRATAPRAAGYLIALGDMPAIQPATLAQVVEGFQADQPTICLPTYDGQKGHPVLFSAHFRADLLNCAGDVGAKAVLAAYPAAVQTVAVQDRGILQDVDTPADWERLSQ